MARVADALGYVHILHVVHRDIKQANIMYDQESDSMKVTDFGLARISDCSRARAGMVRGAPPYMLPEQLAGKMVEGSSGLFSLGVSLCQMVCGKLPFVGGSMAQLMFRITHEQSADILSERPVMPPCVVAVIDKVLAQKVEGRFYGGSRNGGGYLPLCGQLEMNRL